MALAALVALRLGAAVGSLAALELVASALLDVAFGFLTLAASAARLAALIPAAKGAVAARAVHSVSSVSSALVAQGV